MYMLPGFGFDERFLQRAVPCSINQHRRCLKIKHLANLVTISRIVFAFAIVFTQPFSSAFIALYVYCGFSDMIDGSIARKTHTDSKTGERLDSIADFVFVAVCLFKILPELTIPSWLWFWVAVIVIIKVINLISGLYLHRCIFLHTLANKITGFLLFLMPLLLIYFDFSHISVIVCSFATFAAIQEGHFIRAGKNEDA